MTRRGAGAPVAGIYDTGGTIAGEDCLIAFDHNGECRTDYGLGAHQRLETWLAHRGVELPATRPALALVQ